MASQNNKLTTKRKKSEATENIDGIETAKKKVRRDTNELLRALENHLQTAHDHYEQEGIRFSYDAAQIITKEHLAQAKQVLDEHGFIILLNAISPESLKQAMKNIGNCICDMWSETLRDHPDVRTRLKEGKVYAFDQFRNTTHGHGNASFGYFYKQPLTEQDYPRMPLQGDNITFDHNSVHSQVNLELLAHPENKHASVLLMALTHPHGMVSWDSVKFANNPSPKPKGMTKQTMTRMHIDHYPATNMRYQAIDNNDQAVKLFFVPGSDSDQVRDLISQLADNPKLFTSYGHKLCHEISPEFRNVLMRFAIAPPPRARVIWKTGVIHFEGCAQGKAIAEGPYAKCFPCKDLTDAKNQTRLRFIVGTQLAIGLTQESLMRLAVAAERGLLPAVYGSANSKTILHQNIVNRKTTQWKIPRTATEDELLQLRSKLEQISDDQNFSNLQQVFAATITNPFKAYLYGVDTPIDALQLSEQDALLLT